ncbi:MAG: hypothetical protein ACK421_08910 [Pseudanabaenaceae cyanobacterium]
MLQLLVRKGRVRAVDQSCNPAAVEF